MNVKISQLITVMPQIVYWSGTGAKGERRVTVALDGRYLDSFLSLEYESDKLHVVEEANRAAGAPRILKITPLSYKTPYRGTLNIRAGGKDHRKAEAKVMILVQP